MSGLSGYFPSRSRCLLLEADKFALVQSNQPTVGFLSLGLERLMKIRSSLLAGIWLLSSFLALHGSAQSVRPGTQFQVQLLTPLDTGTAQAGQEFSATLAAPLSAGQTVWPKGTEVNGRVVEVVSSGRLKRPASITLQITQIGNSPVETQPEQIDGKSHAGRNVALIGGGAAAGAILGGIAGGGKGAVIGTAAGAGAGTLTAIATGKHEIVLRAETPLTFAVAGGPATQPESLQREAPQPQAPQPTYRSDADSRPDPAYRSDGDRRPQEIEQPPAYREDRDEDHDRSYREERDEGRDRRHLLFSERERDVIRAYFRSEGGQHVARRNGDLPPGLERQLRRDGTLPPGLERRVEPFPEELERRMNSLPRGFSYVILSGRAMILRDDSEIIDIMFIYE